MRLSHSGCPLFFSVPWPQTQSKWVQKSRQQVIFVSKTYFSRLKDVPLGNDCKRPTSISGQFVINMQCIPFLLCLYLSKAFSYLQGNLVMDLSLVGAQKSNARMPVLTPVKYPRADAVWQEDWMTERSLQVVSILKKVVKLKAFALKIRSAATTYTGVTTSLRVRMLNVLRSRRQVSRKLRGRRRDLRLNSVSLICLNTLVRTFKVWNSVANFCLPTQELSAGSKKWK